MKNPSQTREALRLTPVQWVICLIAILGFAFDTYELLMLPLIVRPALMELVQAKPGTPLFNEWVGKLFYIPALAGGIFGLLGGYLTDLLGRRRVLVWSILLYAFSACAAGYATSIQMLLLLRCTTFIGVCVEFVAAVAWLAELFPRSETTGGCSGLHPGLLIDRWSDGDWSLLSRRFVCSFAAHDPWGSRGLALYAHLRVDSSDPASPGASISSRISRLAEPEILGDVKEGQVFRNFLHLHFEKRHS